MYFVLIVTLICCGASLSWAAVSRPNKADRLERASGALLIAGFVLLGFVLPLARHVVHG